MRLIPTRILNSIKPIRQIRNVFAHHLEIDNFDDAGIKKEYFEDLNNKLNTFTDLRFNTDKVRYQKLLSYISFALFIYSKHSKKVSDYLRKYENISKILKEEL